MSSKCIITIKNENWLKREIMLYQNTDGHPNNMLLSLVSELREIYLELSEHGDNSWFLDPGKLAGILIARSVPVITEDMRDLLKALPTSAKNRLESNFFLGIPLLLPESKVYDVNYEYSVTLREDIEEGFFGYKLEVYRLQNNKRISSVHDSETNLSNKRVSLNTVPVPVSPDYE